LILQKECPLQQTFAEKRYTMKTLKKIALSVLVILILALAGGYLYFDRKFTPEENYLAVQHESGPVPFKWLGTGKNVLLLPIHFEGDTTAYYLQLDTGSPLTVFYSKPIQDISQITGDKDRAKASFYIGKTKITSDKFRILNHGNDGKADSLKIIGTVGTDILDGRKTIINFKENYAVLNLATEPAHFKEGLIDFKFKKRKIIIFGILKGKEEQFLFDSGTSAYELLTSKEVWGDLKLPNSKIKVEKEQSWERVLTTYTAGCNQKLKFGSQELPLRNVTHVEGFSQAQYSMMKFSGMTGMLGNKIFLNSSLYIDCAQGKIRIE
jgi:hypothetical protein